MKIGQNVQQLAECFHTPVKVLTGKQIPKEGKTIARGANAPATTPKWNTAVTMIKLLLFLWSLFSLSPLYLYLSLPFWGCNKTIIIPIIIVQLPRKYPCICYHFKNTGFSSTLISYNDHLQKLRYCIIVHSVSKHLLKVVFVCLKLKVIHIHHDLRKMLITLV